MKKLLTVVLLSSVVVGSAALADSKRGGEDKECKEFQESVEQHWDDYRDGRPGNDNRSRRSSFETEDGESKAYHLARYGILEHSKNRLKRDYKDCKKIVYHCSPDISPSSKHSRCNNGWGNGDQDAPGNSGGKNNAENGPKGNNDGRGKNSGNSGRG